MEELVQDIIKRIVQSLKVGVLMAAVILMIMGARAFVARSSISPPVEPLEINYEFHNPECGGNSKVNNTLVDVIVSGGVPPFKYEIDPPDLVYFIISDVGIRFRMKGGQIVILRVSSGTLDGNPQDTLDIVAPSHTEDCQELLNNYTPTSTFTQTSTPTTSNTPTLMPTPTQTRTPSFYPTPTKDNNDFQPTSTPTDAPTETPTPRYDPTPTVSPTPTDKPTPTPSPHPNRAECEDGIDNDEDGFIDLQDQQCTSKNDNHEDK